MSERTFRVWRGNQDGGEFVDYSVEVQPGMVVLDCIHEIQKEHASDLSCRWNCKAGKCGSCSMEINGKPCLLYTSPSPRDLSTSRMPSSA